LEINDITYQDSMRWRVKHSANSATFYAAMPCLNQGATVRPWQERRTRYVEAHVQNVLSYNPSDDNWHDLDLTANSGPLAIAYNFNARLDTGAGGAGVQYVRRNGSSASQDDSTATLGQVASQSNRSIASYILCDDSQIVEESVVNNANVTSSRLSMRGYWEWC